MERTHIGTTRKTRSFVPELREAAAVRSAAELKIKEIEQSGIAR